MSAGLGIPVSTSAGVTLFVILGSITIICQIFILRFVSIISLTVRQRVRHIRPMYCGVTISQYLIILLFVYYSIIQNSHNGELLLNHLSAGNCGKLHAEYLIDGNLHNDSSLLV